MSKARPFSEVIEEAAEKMLIKELKEHENDKKEQKERDVPPNGEIENEEEILNELEAESEEDDLNEPFKTDDEEYADEDDDDWDEPGDD